MSEGLRVGVIGVGVMGRNHVRVLRQMRDVTMVGAADTDDGALRPLAEAGVPVFRHGAELLAQKPEALIVAIPTMHHHDIVMEALSRGVHVLVEKPIASTVAEAEAMIAAADRKNLRLMVGHIERFNPAVRALRDAIDREPLISVSIVRVGPFPPRVNDVGIVIDLGVHDIDLIRWLTGSEIESLQSQIQRTRERSEDIAFMQFRTANGVLAHINTNWLTPYKERRIQASTRTRFLQCDLLLRTVTVYSDYKEDGSFMMKNLSVAQVEPLAVELREFLSAIAEGREPQVTGRDGLASLRWAFECLRQGEAERGDAATISYIM